MTPVAELKLAHRATWAAGDYAAVARHIDDVPPADLLSRMDILPGHEVLDVATGTGNLAIRAAAAGADVVGLDLTPELFETARARAAAHAVVVDWVEGDAEELPFEDDVFDRVVSAFGVQFAPRHQIVAGELAGVTRPGGRIGLVNWTPEGLIGQLFKIMGALHAGPAVVRLAAAAVGQREPRAQPVPGTPRRARVRPRYQPVALRVARGLGLVHGDGLRPDREGARRSSPPRAAGRPAARTCSRWPSAATRRPTAACTWRPST